jgi:hypothetical protein
MSKKKKMNKNAEAVTRSHGNVNHTKNGNKTNNEGNENESNDTL